MSLRPSSSPQFSEQDPFHLRVLGKQMVLSERLSSTILKYSGDHPRYQRQSSVPWQGGKGIRSRRTHAQIYPSENSAMDNGADSNYTEPMAEDKDDRWSWHGSDPTDQHVPPSRSNVKCRSAGIHRNVDGDHARQITLQLVRSRDGTLNVNTITNKSPLNLRCPSAPVSKPSIPNRGSSGHNRHTNNSHVDDAGKLPAALVGKKIGPNSQTANNRSARSADSNSKQEIPTNGQILFPAQRDSTEGELASKISSLHLQYSNGITQPIIMCEDVDKDKSNDGQSGPEDIELQEESLPNEVHCLSVPRVDLAQEKRRPPLRETHGRQWIAC